VPRVRSSTERRIHKEAAHAQFDGFDISQYICIERYAQEADYNTLVVVDTVLEAL
jgi:hypothetical protein